MRETKFIAQNKEKWKEFEQILKGTYKNPDKLKNLFIQITDDLSFSRTFYPNRSVRVYLNGLAQQVFFSIYKSKRVQRSRLVRFWTDELPQLVYEGRRDFRLSFLVFLIAFLIGVLSCANDPEFVRVILGDSYVEMTLENIESGDPMRVYKEMEEFGMTLGITGNNLYVAFLTFVTGALFMLGTLVILVSNAIMVGAFQYFFVEQGLFWESFLTIWIHGTLEISAIIIAGMAGLTMGRGLVFPGTLTRLQSFQQSARRGLKIMVGIVPIIMLAGFFEGYLTRQTEAPDALRALFILLCLGFVLTYFVWYPWYKARKGFRQTIREAKLPPSRNNQLKLDTIKSNGAIFSDIFFVYRKHFRVIGLAALACSVAYTVLVALLSEAALASVLYFPSRLFGTLSVINQFFINDSIALLPLVVILILATFAFVVYQQLQKEAGEAMPNGLAHVLSFGKMVLVATAIYGIIYTNDWYTVFFLLPISLPFLLIWGYAAKVERRHLFGTFGRSLRFYIMNVGKNLALVTMLLVLGALAFTLLDTILSYFYFQFLSWLFSFEQAVMDEITTIALTFATMLVLLLIAAALLLGFGILYYTLREMTEATSLLAKVQTIGTTQRIRGLEKEEVT